MSPATSLFVSLRGGGALARAARPRLHTTCLVALLAMVFAATGAQAQDADATDAERFPEKGFLGAAYVIGFDDFETLENSVGNTSDGHGFSFWLGYRFNQWVATIARGEFVRGFETNFNGDDTDTELASGTIGARVYPLAPISRGWQDRVEPYGEVTIGLGNVDSDRSLNFEAKETNFVARFAVGFDIWVTDSLGLTFASTYWLGNEDLGEFNYYAGNAGIQYRF